MASNFNKKIKNCIKNDLITNDYVEQILKDKYNFKNDIYYHSIDKDNSSYQIKRILISVLDKSLPIGYIDLHPHGSGDDSDNITTTGTSELGINSKLKIGKQNFDVKIYDIKIY
jgi:hypothetical protein